MKRSLIFALFVALVFCSGLQLMAQDKSVPVAAQDAVAPVAQDESAPFTIKLDPIADINPVKTQHTLVATVLDKMGNPLANQRVEWILSRGPKEVGDIVEHDDMNAIVGSNKKIRKLTNHYTVSYTNERAIVLDKGTPDTRDDVSVGVGQTWLTITSPVEGETHIIAFCPAIKNANHHKTFAIKYWVDAKIEWPQDAVNKVGTPHTFRFKLTKASNGQPLVGYRVKWELLQGESFVPAYLGDNQKQTVVQTQTNEMGEASVSLNQLKTIEGINTIKIELRKPTDELLAIRKVTKKWISPKIVVQKNGPSEGILSERVVYTINVSNPGEADANNVVMKDTLPDGISYLDCNVPPSDTQGKILTWNIGSLPKNASKQFTLTCKADKVGKWTNYVEVTSQQYAPQSSKVDTVIGAPDLYIIKEGPALVRKDTLASYKITIKNNGDAVAKDVLIRDEVPAGMKFRSRVNGFALKWKIGNLNPGQSLTYTYDLQAIRTGEFINTAKAIMKGKVVHTTNFKTKVIAPDLKLTKTGSLRVFLNKTAAYTIKIANEGDASAKEIVVVDTLPKNLDYISSSPRGAFRPGKGDNLATITWKLGEIQAGSSSLIKLQTRANTVGRCRNSVKLRSDSAELPKIQPLEAHADTLIRGVPAMHINSYDTEDPVEVGGQTIYVIETRNEGTSACTQVVLVNIIDEEMELISATGPVPHKVKGNTVIFDPVPILQPAERLTYKIVCRAIKEGSAKNTAKLRYLEFNKEILDEEGTSIYK